MQNSKWGVVNNADERCYVVLLVSRKKDNIDISDFVERRESFITTYDFKSDYLRQKFNDFVNAGLPGEQSRIYYSVNARHLPTIRKQLLHFLIDDDKFNLCSIQSKIAGIAAQKDCAIEKKWMIDFDSKDAALLKEMLNDIKQADDTIDITTCDTPNGHAVILNHGFDIRLFAEKWKDVATIKKDDLQCINWKRKV